MCVSQTTTNVHKSRKSRIKIHQPSSVGIFSVRSSSIGPSEYAEGGSALEIKQLPGTVGIRYQRVRIPGHNRGMRGAHLGPGRDGQHGMFDLL